MPTLRQAWALLGVLCSLLWSAPSRAQPAGTVLSRARTAYQARQYRQVIALLRPALYPSSTLASVQEEQEAYTLLGKAYWWQAQLTGGAAQRKRLRTLAEQQFLSLLSLAPNAKLSRLYHPKPLVDFFEKVRKKLIGRSSPLKALETELKHCRKTLGTAIRKFSAYRKRCQTQVQVTRTVRRRQFFWNFVPFGVGQFQNDQKVKGALFAAFQGAALLANVTLFVLGDSPFVRTDWGENLKLDPDTGVTDPQAKRRARRIQQAQIVTGTLFWSLVAWGIIDAVVYYKKTTVTQDRRLIPIGSSNLELSPTFGGDRFTLGVTYRF